MTALSYIRMRGIANSSLIGPTRADGRAVVKATMILIGIVTASLSIALNLFISLMNTQIMGMLQRN